MTLTAEELETKETVILDSVFVTSTDGRIFEIPKAQAENFEVSMEREQELGHLPILPYTVLGEPELDDVPELEVEGHNMACTPCGRRYWHQDRRYGSYTNRCGQCCCGWHYHPYCNSIGYPC